MMRGALSPLPIDAVLPELVDALRASPSVVLEAPPGAGKTTRVPGALLSAGFAEKGEILVLQPRRLPTRLAATRVAQELGEAPGRTVGYQFRHERVGGPGTRIRFLTEGTLTRRLLTDPLLEGVSAVILDELHERHLVTDLALSLLRRLQATRRPDLRLLAMSATLDGEKIASFLGTDAVLRSEGRRFEVEVQHQERQDDRPLHEQVAGAVKRLLASGLDGHVLVFLPGASEIRRAAQALRPVAEDRDLLVLPLHGSLPPSMQDEALAPSRKRKILLSTNVAETSVTIDGIAAVIDSGLVRVAGHSPFSGLPSLQLGKISQASATQRAGRAGRTRQGTAIRLYSQQDLRSRPAHDVPEILRVDLSETLLALRGMGLDPGALPWLDEPPAAALEGAAALLERLGAFDGAGGLSPIGRRLLAFPVHPRLGRWIVEGERLGVAPDACLLAALASERDILQSSRAFAGSGGPKVSGPSDLLDRRERFREAEKGGFSSGRLAGLGLDRQAVESVRRAEAQLRRISRVEEELRGEEADEALLRVILSGFSDRVAKRREPRARELLLSGGGTASLSEESVVWEDPFLVAVAADQGGRGVTVRWASRIEPEWLLEEPGIEERDELVWNSEAGRVERWTRILYGSVALDESRAPAPPSEEVSRLLAREVIAKGIGRFLPEGAWEGLEVRLALAREHLPEAGIPSLDGEAIFEALVEVLEGMRSLDDLSDAGLREGLLPLLLGEKQQLLDRQLPTRIALGGGRMVRIHYDAGKPPWVESRIQDFFGMREGPSILGGRIPLTLHLLAPNQRAVQVTQDLAGFWQRHYPSLRRELGRRYPKHAWPEDGATASPPAPRQRR